MDPDKNILNNGGDQPGQGSRHVFLIDKYFIFCLVWENWENIFDFLREDDPLPLYIWTPPNLLSKPSSLNSDLNKYSECPDGWSEEGEGGGKVLIL